MLQLRASPRAHVLLPPLFHGQRVGARLRCRASRPLAPLQSLSVLRFRKSQIGDAGVKQIVKKKTINNLVLANSKVTDLSGSEFKSLPALYYLDLSGTLVTDKSVPELMQNAGLTYLNVSGTGISTQGVAMLEAALPNCKVVR